MGFDEGWEYDAGYEAEFDSEFDADYGAEDLYLSLLPDEERQRFWSESIWSDPIDEEFRMDSLLFTHRGSEAELPGRSVSPSSGVRAKAGRSRWTNSSKCRC